MNRSMLVILTLITANNSQAAPGRIQEEVVSTNEVRPIRLVEGMVSVLEFREKVLEVRVGNPEIAQVSFSEVSPKEVTLRLLTSKMGATNMIVRSGRRLLVFDVVPTKSTHEDFLKIRGEVQSLSPNGVSLIHSGKISAPKGERMPKDSVLIMKGEIR